MYKLIACLSALAVGILVSSARAEEIRVQSSATPGAETTTRGKPALFACPPIVGYGMQILRSGRDCRLGVNDR